MPSDSESLERKKKYISERQKENARERQRRFREKRKELNGKSTFLAAHPVLPNRASSEKRKSPRPEEEDNESIISKRRREDALNQPSRTSSEKPSDNRREGPSTDGREESLRSINSRRERSPYDNRNSPIRIPSDASQNDTDPNESLFVPPAPNIPSILSLGVDQPYQPIHADTSSSEEGDISITQEGDDHESYEPNNLNDEEYSIEEEETVANNEESSNISSTELFHHIFESGSICCPCHSNYVPKTKRNDNEPDILSMTELSAAWFKDLPKEFTGAQSILNRDSRLKREDPLLKDFQAIDFRPFVSVPPAQLSIAKSELPSLYPYRIIRTYDIDSSIFVLSSLQACRSTIEVAYNPPHFKTLTHTLRFTVRLSHDRKYKSGEIHKLKNICFASLADHKGYTVHIFFPHMHVGVKGINTLNSAQKTAWVDNILIPAMKEVLPKDILHHHPASCADAVAKSLAKSESGAAQRVPTELRYDVPEQYLGRLWENIEQNCSLYQTTDSTVPDNAFYEPILLLSMHNSKIRTRYQSTSCVLEENFRHLTSILNFSYVDMENSYQDFGFEDTPECSSTAITFLRKAGCLGHWASNFEDPKTRKKIKVDQYNWALTKDAGAGEFQCRMSNAYFKAGLAHGKAYNVNKEMFSAIPAGYLPFDNPILEFIGLNDDTLQEVIQRSKWNGKEQRKVSREIIMKKLRLATTRLRIALNDQQGTHFGTRQEYRIRVQVLKDFFEETTQRYL
ncbi:MAG: hypothetical protein Q9190_005916 [Brigantiaea leucoxantha]